MSSEPSTPSDQDSASASPSSTSSASQPRPQPIPILHYATVRDWAQRLRGVLVTMSPQDFLMQAAHRLIAISVWLLAAQVGLAIFSYAAGAERWVLPAALIALIVSLMCEFAAYWVARSRHRSAGEPYALMIPTGVLIAMTAAWMILALIRR